MVRDDNFLTLVKIISATLPSELTDYYNRAKEDPDFILKLKSYMGSWYTEHEDAIDMNEPLFLVWYTVENSMELANNADQAYAKYVDNRRSSKKNWLNKLKKEYEAIEAGQESTDGLLSRDANSYFSLKAMNGPVSGSFTDKKEYIERRYDEVVAWQKDKDTSLISFIYFETLQPIQKCKAFMIEVGLFTFSNIKNEMHGDLESGLFTSVPDSVFKNAFFSTQQNTYEQLSFQFVKGKKNDGRGTGVFFNTYETSSDTDVSTVRTAVKTVDIDEKEARDSSIIQSLQNEYKLSERAKSLDPIDFQILQIICSNINVSVLSGDDMDISLKSIARQIYKKKDQIVEPDKQSDDTQNILKKQSTSIRSRDYLRLLRHIDKLANYTLTATRVNKETNVVDKVMLHFIDTIHYQVPTNNQSEVRNIDKDIREFLDESNEDLEGVGGYDISETILQISPGRTIIDSWKQNTLQRVYSKTYDQIEDAKTKLFLTIMETERLRIYPRTSQTLDISFFTNRLQFNMTPSKARSAIKDGLQSLMNKGIVVQNFEFQDKKRLYIDYVPVNNTEKLVYKIE